jgi:hypothetical protein
MSASLIPIPDAIQDAAPVLAPVLLVPIRATVLDARDEPFDARYQYPLPCQKGVVVSPLALYELLVAGSRREQAFPMLIGHDLVIRAVDHEHGTAHSGEPLDRRVTDT